MPMLTVFTRPPFRQTYDRYRAAQQKRQINQREMVKDLGREWVELARQEAPEGRTGKFRKSIGYRTDVKSNDVIELRTFHAQPLGTWITQGTKPHIIRARGRALKFLWERGPRSSNEFTAYHFYRFVNHPGTKPNPYHVRATKRWRPGAIVALKKIVQRFVIDLKG